MSYEVGRLKPGKVDPEQLRLLLEGTSIKAESVIQALHEHLVEGHSVAKVAEKLQVNTNWIYKRLRAVQAEHERAAQLSRFYIQPAPDASPAE